jgi:hypothetical protein
VQICDWSLPYLVDKAYKEVVYSPDVGVRVISFLFAQRIAHTTAERVVVRLLLALFPLPVPLHGIALCALLLMQELLLLRLLSHSLLCIVYPL